MLAHEKLAGSVDQSYRYVGQLGYYTHYQEPALGLLQLGLRFYDPEAARFTQVDAIQDGLNWYSYVAGNPLYGVDRTGLKEKCKVHSKELIADYTSKHCVAIGRPTVVVKLVSAWTLSGPVPDPSGTKRSGQQYFLCLWHKTVQQTMKFIREQVLPYCTDRCGDFQVKIKDPIIRTPVYKPVFLKDFYYNTTLHAPGLGDMSWGIPHIAEKTCEKTRGWDPYMPPLY